MCFRAKNVDLISCYNPIYVVLIINPLRIKKDDLFAILILVFLFWAPRHWSISVKNIRTHVIVWDNTRAAYCTCRSCIPLAVLMKVWSTWRCSLVGDFSIRALRDCSVTDGHHGHELQDDSSCGLQEVKRALWLLMFFNKTCHNKTETKQPERPWWYCGEREQWQRQFDRLWSNCMTHTQPATTVITWWVCSHVCW